MTFKKKLQAADSQMLLFILMTLVLLLTPFLLG